MTTTNRRAADRPGRNVSEAGSVRLIESVQNPRVKHVMRLRRRSHRDKEGLMLIEGSVELEMALDNGLRPDAVFHIPDLRARTGDAEIINRCRESGVGVFACSPRVFRKMAYRDQPGGVIAVAPQAKKSLGELSAGADPLMVVADSIEKPGNIGAILRSADAAGADAVIVCGDSTDIHNPNVVRASMGTLFSVPTVVAEPPEAMAWLRARGIKILAATPGVETEYWDVEMCKGVAIVVGGEHGGLSGLWMKEADLRVGIPMLGRADSLNVAVAAAILLFEASRQRKS